MRVVAHGPLVLIFFFNENITCDRSSCLFSSLKKTIFCTNGLNNLFEMKGTFSAQQPNVLFSPVDWSIVSAY